MPFGLLTGLGAALAWGTLDIVTALTSRVIGSLRVTAGMQLVTAVLFADPLRRHGRDAPRRPGHDRDLDPARVSSAPAPTSPTSRASSTARSRWSAGSSPRSVD